MFLSRLDRTEPDTFTAASLARFYILSKINNKTFWSREVSIYWSRAAEHSSWPLTFWHLTTGFSLYAEIDINLKNLLFFMRLYTFIFIQLFFFILFTACVLQTLKHCVLICVHLSSHSDGSLLITVKRIRQMIDCLLSHLGIDHFCFSYKLMEINKKSCVTWRRKSLIYWYNVTSNMLNFV